MELGKPEGGGREREREREKEKERETLGHKTYVAGLRRQYLHTLKNS